MALRTFPPRKVEPPSEWLTPGIHRGTDLEWPQCLFPHYFDSELLQIEDSATPGLGNFLASCNVLSLNWFFRDNYLRPSDCSRRQAEKCRWHIFIFRHVLGLLSFLTWTHKYGKGKTGQREKLLLRPELGSSNANLYVENMHRAPTELFHIFPLAFSYWTSGMDTRLSISQWRKLRIIEVGWSFPGNRANFQPFPSLTQVSFLWTVRI